MRLYRGKANRRPHGKREEIIIKKTPLGKSLFKALSGGEMWPEVCCSCDIVTLTTVQHRGQNHHMRARATSSNSTKNIMATIVPSD